MHCHPLVGGHGALLHDGSVGRRQTAAQARSRRKVEFLWQRHQVEVGVSHSDRLSQRAPCGEPRLELIVANLRSASQALTTCAATGDERHRHALSNLPAMNARTNLRNDARKFMARHVWKALNVRIVASPTMPVAAANASGMHANHDAVGVGRGVGDLLDFDRSIERTINGCFQVFRSMSTSARGRAKNVSAR
jgi:hypothetical protein